MAFGLLATFSPRFFSPPATKAAGSAPVIIVNTPLPTTVANYRREHHQFWLKKG